MLWHESQIAQYLMSWSTLEPGVIFLKYMLNKSLTKLRWMLEGGVYLQSEIDVFLFELHNYLILLAIPVNGNELMKLCLRLQEKDGSEGDDQPSSSDSLTEDKIQLDSQAVDEVNNAENKDQGDIQVSIFGDKFYSFVHQETGLEINFWLESVLGSFSLLK